MIRVIKVREPIITRQKGYVNHRCSLKMSKYFNKERLREKLLNKKINEMKKNLITLSNNSSNKSILMKIKELDDFELYVGDTYKNNHCVNYKKIKLSEYIAYENKENKDIVKAYKIYLEYIIALSK